MSIKKRISYSFLTHLIYKFSFIISPIILFPLIINNLGTEIFKFWISINSILIFIFANDFGIGMSKLMELNEYLKKDISIFKRNINTLLNFKVSLYLGYIALIFIIIFFFKIKVIFILLITSVIYQSINHISIVLSHALWASGKNWIIYLINGIGQILEIIIFLILFFILDLEIKSFIAFPILSILRFLFLILIVHKLKLFNYDFNFDKDFLFSKKKGIFGFIFETLSSNTKFHLLRFLLGIILSGFKFTQITILFTLANFSKNICASLSQIIFPELNHIIKNLNKFKEYSIEYIRFGFYFNLIICSFFLFFGEKLTDLWLSNSSFFDKKLFIIILSIVFIKNFNELIAYVYQSVNKHLSYYSIYLSLLISSLVLFLITKDIVTLLSSYLFIECMMIFLNFYFLNRLLNINNIFEIFSFSKFIKSSFRYITD